MIGYEVEAEGLDEQMQLLEQFPEESQRELMLAMQKAVYTIESNVKPLVPVDRGRLRASIGSEVTVISSLSIEGRVGPSMTGEVYPVVMEFGREPGSRMPPVEALEPWVRRVIQPDKKDVRRIAFLIARSIGKKGIKAREYLKQGWERSKKDVTKYFAQAVENIAEGLSNGCN